MECKDDDKAFIFTLKNDHGVEPTRFMKEKKVDGRLVVVLIMVHFLIMLIIIMIFILMIFVIKRIVVGLIMMVKADINVILYIRNHYL